jgi:hypothetical protein
VNEVVYFFKNETGRIKIGYTNHIERRQRQLENNTGPLSLLGTMPGGLAEEQQLHRKFAHLRQHGEWFDADPELTGYIESLDQPWTAPELGGITTKRRVVEVQVLTVNGRNMTKSFYRQLPRRRIIDRGTGELLGVPWGFIQDEKTGLELLWQEEDSELCVDWAKWNIDDLSDVPYVISGEDAHLFAEHVASKWPGVKLVGSPSERFWAFRYKDDDRFISFPVRLPACDACFRCHTSPAWNVMPSPSPDDVVLIDDFRSKLESLLEGHRSLVEATKASIETLDSLPQLFLA